MSDQRLQTRGGERWPGARRASEMRRSPRRSKPQRPGPLGRGSLGPTDGGQPARSEVPAYRLGLKRWKGGPPTGRGLPETVSPPGALRSKPHKHRARDALESGGLAALKTRHASMSRGVEARGSSKEPWRPARPRFLSGCGDLHQTTAYPVPQRNRAVTLGCLTREESTCPGRGAA